MIVMVDYAPDAGAPLYVEDGWKTREEGSGTAGTIVLLEKGTIDFASIEVLGMRPPNFNPRPRARRPGALSDRHRSRPKNSRSQPTSDQRGLTADTPGTSGV